MPAASLLAFDLRIAVRDVTPKIWRLVRVPHDVRMDRLHDVLQTAFGWTNSHLHQFHLFDKKGRVHTFVTMSDPENLGADFGQGTKTLNETACTLREFLAKPGDRIGYEYDFGDGWMHEIALAAVHPQSTRLTRALCLDGARAGPPDDSGGPYGYAQMLQAVANPRHPEHADMKDWLGDFDPEAFNLAATNRALARRTL